ncbi:hypothetical protein ACOSQ4_023589 [Xanthoceras sorbifolium]
MITRSKVGVFKPKVLLTKGSDIEPQIAFQALKHTQWVIAMNEKFQALQRNKTWTLVPPLAGRKIIRCKWVFRIKRNSDGSIMKYKARFITKGFHQIEGFDFHETFSPVVKSTTIRVILTLALAKHWFLR